MAKKFMYVCLGVLALVVAFHLGARYGSASIVDHATTGVIAIDGHMVLLDTGGVWELDATFLDWHDHSYYTPPLPLSSIKFWSRSFFITDANEAWCRKDGAWHNCGSPPGLVSAQSTTWGQIKAAFGE